MRRHALAILAPALVLSLAACGQGDGAKTDPATRDNAQDATLPPPQTQTTLPTGAPIWVEPAQAQLVETLRGGGAGRVALRSIEFEGERLRADPNTAVTSLAAILNAHPQSRVTVEVSSGQNGDPELARTRARALVEALGKAGVPAERLTVATGRDGSEGQVVIATAAGAAASQAPAR